MGELQESQELLVVDEGVPHPVELVVDLLGDFLGQLLARVALDALVGFLNIPLVLPGPVDRHPPLS